MPIGLTLDERVATLTLDRPEKLNALDISHFEAFASKLDEVAADPRICAVILTGSGSRAFCVGVDIAELSLGDADESARRVALRQQVNEKLANLPVPSVAVIDGLAMGGGVELALSCTFRLATQRARFSMPEIKLGLIPGGGGTQRLPRLLGPSRALQLMLSGRTIEAEEALSLGIVDQLVDDAKEGARAFVNQWTSYSRAAVSALLTAVRAPTVSMEQGLAVEAAELNRVLQGPGAKEGVTAFLEKRSPDFKGF